MADINNDNLSDSEKKEIVKTSLGRDLKDGEKAYGATIEFGDNTPKSGLNNTADRNMPYSNPKKTVSPQNGYNSGGHKGLEKKDSPEETFNSKKNLPPERINDSQRREEHSDSLPSNNELTDNSAPNESQEPTVPANSNVPQGPNGNQMPLDSNPSQDDLVDNSIPSGNSLPNQNVDDQTFANGKNTSDLPKDSINDENNPNKDGLDDKAKVSSLDTESKKESSQPSVKDPSLTPTNQATKDAENPNGNGYGTINNKREEEERPAPPSTNDNVQKNLDMQRRMAAGRKKEEEEETAKKGKELAKEKETPQKSTKSSLGNRIKNKLGFKNKGKFKSGLDSSGEDLNDNPDKGLDSLAAGLKKALSKFLLHNPVVLIVLAIIILFFLIVLFAVLFDDNSQSNNNNNNSNSTAYSGNGAACTYELTGILDSGPVKVDGIQVELVNCEATKSNYRVVDTVDFEKYVIGVALAEVSFSNKAYFQTQIVAARNFALTRNRAMCPAIKENCFYGYNPNTGKIRMRACVNDQVYCDYEKDCYRQKRSGKALYSPELTAADLSNGAYVWKSKLNETKKAEVLAAAKEVEGKVLVKANGDVVYTNFINTDQNAWYKLATQGYTYDQILLTHYASKGAAKIYDASCTETGSQTNPTQGGETGGTTTGDSTPYSNYKLSSEGTTYLREELNTFLPKNGSSLTEFNNNLASKINSSGFGTRNGVIAAGVTLVGELANRYGVKLKYELGGGHLGSVGGGISNLALGTLGGTLQGSQYRLTTFDCSGFVSWAIWNGGFKLPGKNATLASSFRNIKGVSTVTLSPSQAVIQPGDLLESNKHVILVVGIDNDRKQYICAESSGNGLVFSRRSFAESGYWGDNMEAFYNNSANKRGGQA